MSRPVTESTPPNEMCLTQGAAFWSQIDRDGSGRSGAIWDNLGVVRWRFAARRNPAGRSWCNPFNTLDFVVTEAANGAELVIRRASWAPSVFQIRDGEEVIGQVRVRSLLRHRYSIEIDGVNTWTFRMPIFTLNFYANSESGTDIWVVVGPSKMDWKILMRPGSGDRQLVAALAFIHTEWWNLC